MAESTTKKPRFTRRRLSIIILSLIILVGVVLVGKFFVTRTLAGIYTAQLNQALQQQSIKDTAEEAAIVASTITAFPSPNAPLYKNQAQLQQYISSLRKGFKRDIVVMDKEKKILADAIPSNSGQIYKDDSNGEVTQTISTGKAHAFVEKSKDYPKGILEVVLPLRDTTGTIVGAIMISATHTKD